MLASINSHISFWIRNISNNKWENFLNNSGPKSVAGRIAFREKSSTNVAVVSQVGIQNVPAAAQVGIQDGDRIMVVLTKYYNYLNKLL